MQARMFFSRGGGTPSGPKGQRAYVVGDVHGRLDLLNELLASIELEVEDDRRSKASIVFVGDLIDRGPDSSAVVERLRTYSSPRISLHFIMGNHEEVMLKVLAGDPNPMSSWLRFGGIETLQSYGLESAELSKLKDEDLVDRVKRAIPDAHRKFITAFADSISFGQYLFVHAGIRPGVALSEQSQADLRWIREPFLADSTDHGFVVVHGHTITSEVEVSANRIGIDTGAYFSGTLTALGIEGRKRWLLQTSHGGTKRIPLDG